MGQALQVAAIEPDREEVSIGLELVGQRDLLCRVACKIAGENYAALVCGDLWGELGMVGEPSVGVEYPPQSTAIRSHLHAWHQ